MSIRGFEKLSHMPRNLKGHMDSAQVWVHAHKKILEGPNALAAD